jgi:nucleoid-associated protein YgaU
MASRGYRFRTGGTPPQDEPPVSPTPEEPLPAPPPAPDEIYIVQPGDTLGGIAKKLYGDFRLWPVILEANRDKIADPSLIRVGMELLIPPQT